MVSLTLASLNPVGRGEPLPHGDATLVVAGCPVRGYRSRAFVLDGAVAVNCAHSDRVFARSCLPGEVPLHPRVVVQRVTEFRGLPWAIVDGHLNF